MTIGDVTGRVEGVHAFSVHISDPYTNLVTEIPNGKVWSQPVKSMLRAKNFKLSIPLLISHRNDLRMVEKAIREIVYKHPKVKKVSFHYVSQDERGLSIHVSLKVKQTDKLLDLKSELQRYLKIGLQDRGIVFVDGPCVC